MNGNVCWLKEVIPDQNQVNHTLAQSSPFSAEEPETSIE